MAWIELKFNTSAQMAESLTESLTALGALAVTAQDAGDQPLYEPTPGSTPLWNEVIITGLFEENFDLDALIDHIHLHHPDLKPTFNRLADCDWERTWMQDFKPIRFGPRLWIIPSYQTEAPLPHQVILDPGLAFGTGKHPTTALCLQWLDQNIKSGETLIDYGCGSGILGIAALKLGAEKVYAIDHDPQALIATQENAKQNALSEEQIITLYPNELQPLRLQADVLIANILANPLIELAEKFNCLLPSKGKLVLSGILQDQANEVIQAYQPFFEIITVQELEGWVRIDGYKTFF